jgi:hypothetical protein
MRGPALTIGTSDPSGLDVAGIDRAVLALVEAQAPGQVAAARRLLDRLRPDRWALEWQLPWWLGAALDLDDETRHAAVVSNVLGLAFVRLQDDLADAELAPDDLDAVPALAAILYEGALRPYRSWFDVASPFWAFLDATLRTWRAAMVGGDPNGSDLAARGAPLRIGAFGLCLRAGRPGAYPDVERCLDRALDALVRYDHVADWRSDLEAGRWNAFVADVSPGPQAPTDRARRRRETLAAMLASDAVAAQFARIRDGLLAAGELADRPSDPAGLPVPGLAAHLRRLADTMATQGTDFAAELTAAGDRAARLLLQSGADDR